MRTRIIIILFVYIAAQTAKTDAQALPLVLILCLTVLDCFLLIVKGKGLIHHLKSSENESR